MINIGVIIQMKKHIIPNNLYGIICLLNSYPLIAIFFMII